jgi:XRE family transcriptional regulator, regulator of sulfur utilization
MQKRTIQRGRPAGSTTYDAELAKAFGLSVKARRTEQGVAQEALAHMAGVERSHMGKIERGEHIPTLPLIFKIAEALGCTVTALVSAMEGRLSSSSDDMKKDVADK